LGVGVYYADILVSDSVICEIKAVRRLLPEHESQVIHYLKATGIKVGLLLNFGSTSVQVKRLVF
jgi:GxxExxY protein